MFFSSFFFIFRILLSFSVFSPHFSRRLLLPSLFDALPLHIGCPALFLHFPSIPLPSIPRCGCSVFFHPSFLFSVSYALFLPFLLIFRAGCCCLRFSMHYSFISVVRRFFFIFPLFPFLLFPAAVVSCFLSPVFFIYRALRSFLDFFSYFSRRLFLRFFLIPGRK